MSDGSRKTSPTIQIRGLTKRFVTRGDRVIAVNDLNLDIGAGELLAFLGPSGTGKTTLLRLIAGFESPDRGSISIDGQPVVDVERNIDVSPERRNVGMIFQDYSLFPHLTVADNVAFGIKHMPNSQHRVMEVLELVGLAGMRSRFPHQLSGGQQQRVALARTLAPHPSVILMDEPFNALDATLRPQVREQVEEILRRSGTTAILVTHDAEEAMIMADRVGVVYEGGLEQVGSPEEVYYHPKTLFVAKTVAQADPIPGIASNGNIHTEVGDFPCPSNIPPGNVYVAVYHDAVTFKSGGICATVEKRAFRGELIYRLRLASGTIIHMEQRTRGTWSVGEQIPIGVSLPNVIVFPAPTGEKSDPHNHLRDQLGLAG
ncbi:MAG: ATP-binding cassette domain-containing protein [Deltaproteobacteria bacterium]|nr:ATP-binding cassette domain-containing protein [Deltaproteobacteria bacterium]